jgi:hypothetical protein
MSNTEAKKMVAKFSGHCPCCDRKIKAGSDSIRYLAGTPVTHWDCYARMVSAPVETSYCSLVQAVANRAEMQARYDAAAVKASAKTETPSAGPGERGVFGSQLAEDMGDFSGHN